MEGESLLLLPTPAPTTNGASTTNGTGTPPPLMPRPPADYIKETQEEDARLSRLNGDAPNLNGTPKKLNGSSSSTSLNKPAAGASGGLDIKPFTPFRAGFGDIVTPGPPPPLPPKAAE
ncbi:hypothetical protein NLJ89_g11076 [Agrocybe chaxingu]|uniref:Uncharacterized protein n=1 Tax=Agrocybe chaxingu TaxID=84603 RepID=A0A9W8JMJ0_9AGAR|nr:hypothetical protein NLJ89_g11076 [Agrocybe chaxingu]